MDEYISVSDLKNVFAEVYGKESPIAKGWIDWVETKVKKADVEPVRHGHWIETSHERDFPPYYYHDFTCSNCRNREQNKRVYCPECGAKMDEEDNQ